MRNVWPYQFRKFEPLFATVSILSFLFLNLWMPITFNLYICSLNDVPPPPQAAATSTNGQDSGDVDSDVASTPDGPDATQNKQLTPSSSNSNQKTAPRGQLTTRGRRGSDADDALLSSLQDQGTHLLVMQQRLLDHLKPQGDQERLGFAEFVRSTLLSFNQDCWRRCQKDMLQLLMRYIDENETARRSQPISSASNPVPRPSSHAPAVTASAYLGASSASYGQASSQHMWQPPPSQWPSHVENPTSVWGSMEPRWMQQEFPQFNTSCSSQPRPSTAPPTSTTNSALPSVRLGSLTLLSDLDAVTPQSAYQASPAARAKAGGNSQIRRLSDQPLDTPPLQASTSDFELYLSIVDFPVVNVFKSCRASA